MEDDISAALDRWQRAEKIQQVNNEVALFENTGDGRFFWRAIVRIVESGETLPTSYTKKLAEIGGNLLTAITPNEIAAALEFAGDKGAHIGPKQSRAYVKRWRLASEVRQVKDFYSIPLARAIEAVARNNKLTVSKVKKDYHSIFTKQRPKQTGNHIHALNGAMNAFCRK